MPRLLRPLAAVVLIGGLILGAAGRGPETETVASRRVDAMTAVAAEVGVPAGRSPAQAELVAWMAIAVALTALATGRSPLVLAARAAAGPVTRAGRPRSPPPHRV